jgi:hypothetical protein
MKKTLITLLVIAITGCVAFGQSSVSPNVINTTGNTYTSGHYILDWSIGELALVNLMEESTQSKYIITNGFIQPFTQDPNLTNNNGVFGDGEIIILPNPTQNILEIDFRTKQKGAMNYRLYDVLGRVLFTNSFSSYGYGQIEKIDMTGARAGSYFLRIELNPDLTSVHKTGSYKIIKL